MRSILMMLQYAGQAYNEILIVYLAHSVIK